MFFFTSNTRKVHLERLRSVPYSHGKCHVERVGSAGLLWFENRFTAWSKLGKRLTIFVKQPESDEPICQFCWDLGSGQLSVSRRWSGEFSLYLSTKPDLIITSHLKLAALACRGVPPGTKQVRAGFSGRLSINAPDAVSWVRRDKFFAPSGLDYGATVKRVRGLVYASMKGQPDCTALLLSGGLDSSILAAVAASLGRRFPAFVFSVKRPIRPQMPLESDLECARALADYLRIPCTEILLNGQDVVGNIPLAVSLTETPRGTIIDPCAALIEVARAISRRGFSRILMGEAADDLFGGFGSARRFYRGAQLRAHYRHELDFGLPDELCVLQKIFEPWSVSLIDPFWTADLKKIGYNIPVSFRMGPKDRTKRILRDAFKDLLPDQIVNRPKYVTRDATQVRYVLEKEYGLSRERYRPIFRKFFSQGEQWQATLPRLKS